MLISENSFKYSSVEQKIERSEEAFKEILNVWSMVSQLVEQPGWLKLNEYIEKEFEENNSIYNANPNELEYKRGYCTGLKYPAQIIKSLKRKAVEAQRYLDSIAKQEKEQ